MRPLGSPAHRRPAIASLRKPGAARRGLLGVLLAAAVFGGPWGGASWVTHAATLDLNGLVVTLPAAPFFTTPYLTGSNGVTNSSLSSATLIEGGGPAGTTYTGVISNWRLRNYAELGFRDCDGRRFDHRDAIGVGPSNTLTVSLTNIT